MKVIVRRVGAEVKHDPCSHGGRYLEKFPGGVHAAEARRSIDEIEHQHEAARKQEERRLQVVSLRKRFDAIVLQNRAAPLEEIEKEFARLPTREAGVKTDDDLRVRDQLGGDIGLALKVATSEGYSEGRTPEMVK